MTDNDPNLVELVEELSASGDDPIVAVGISDPVTLRSAIGKVFWKTASVLRLGNRPVSPVTEDDQFGHVLSARAEGLINQALLQAIITKLNGDPAKIDTKAIRDNVIRSLNS